MALQNAIDHWHSLLDDEMAGETQAQLDDQLRRRGLFFGSRPLCTVLRPRLLTAAQYAFLQNRCALLMGAFGKAYTAAMQSREVLARFALEEWEYSLIQPEPGFAQPSPVSRLDAFFVHERGGLRFTEYNAETPAAAAYNDVLAEVFLGLPVMREFMRRYEVRPQPSRQNVMHALLDSWRQFSRGRSRPRIAILDWRGVPTWSEFVITAEYLRSQGLDCVIADPHEVEYTNGHLIAEGERIDLVYKRVLISELIERGGIDHPIVRAVLDRAVCMVNPFRCKILHKKASLAVLSDERNSELFSHAEREAIEAHIPWTRLVEHRHTRIAGRDIDLVPYILENRESLVLKPNDEYGGAGIVLGWESDPLDWEAAISHALTEPFVVQERVSIPVETYPILHEGRVHIEDRILDTAPFIYYGAFMDGCLTRLSTESLVNVTAGGGSSLATFVVEPR
jgi:glutathionylspermidine synthase